MIFAAALMAWAFQLVPGHVASQALVAGQQPVSAPPPVAAQQPAAARPPVAAPRPVALPRPAMAQPPVATLVADTETLDPGEYVWRPELSPVGPVEIVVSIPQQIAYVYRSGMLIGVTTVSTGRPGHETPTGRFPIMEKRREHYSNLYNNAPMPFMQRLTMDGIALHAGRIPGHPASHGCVRLPLEFARRLFAVTAVGANVHILDEAPTAETALAVARGEPLPPAPPPPAPQLLTFAGTR